MQDIEKEIAQEIIKNLPMKEAYNDALSPSMKQAGNIAEDIIKTVALALAPIQYLGALQDRYRRFLDTSIRRIDEADRISPPSQILGPALEGIKYEPEGTPIEEMFSQLLSRSMDKSRINEAHPSYPFIIKQLSSDEALVLKRLSDREFNYIYTQELHDEFPHWRNMIVEIDEFPKHGLIYADNLLLYIDRLNQLGLAHLPVLGNGEPIYDCGKQIGLRSKAEYRLTNIGKQFVAACIGE